MAFIYNSILLCCFWIIIILHILYIARHTIISTHLMIILIYYLLPNKCCWWKLIIWVILTRLLHLHCMTMGVFPKSLWVYARQRIYAIDCYKTICMKIFIKIINNITCKIARHFWKLVLRSATSRVLLRAARVKLGNR